MSLNSDDLSWTNLSAAIQKAIERDGRSALLTLKHLEQDDWSVRITRLLFEPYNSDLGGGKLRCYFIITSMTGRYASSWVFDFPTAESLIRCLASSISGISPKDSKP